MHSTLLIVASFALLAYCACAPTDEEVIQHVSPKVQTPSDTGKKLLPLFKQCSDILFAFLSLQQQLPVFHTEIKISCDCLNISCSEALAYRYISILIEIANCARFCVASHLSRVFAVALQVFNSIFSCYRLNISFSGVQFDV